MNQKCPFFHNRFAHFALAFALMALASCGPGQNQNTLIVAASIYPVADWCANLVPDGVKVLCLVPPSSDPHWFEPGVQQAKDISRAKLVVCIGSGFDYWIEPLAREAADGRDTLIFLSEHEADEADDHSGHGLHEHRNPHYWLDPIWAQEAVVRISNRLIQAMPGHADEINAKTQAYRDQLRDLHFEIAEAIQTLPHKTYVGDHGSFYHFAKRYGLSEAASIEPWAGKEPSIQDVREIIDQLKRMPKPVIFIEPQRNRKAADIIAAEVPCPVLILDPMGRPDDPQRDTYLKVMRYNLQSLREGLGD